MPDPRTARDSRVLTSECLTRQLSVTSSLVDLTPTELAIATSRIRSFFRRRHFAEILLSPMDSYPIDYLDQSLDVPGVGQLRFNTEPEIWQARGTCSRFFSISHLFRRESELNPLRRASFIIVDFYAPGPPDALWHLFQGVLRDLTRAHLTESLLPLKLDSADYNPALDGPNLTSLTTRWVLTSGYDAAHSFFEIDETGRSTRQEIFLVTPRGHLEIGALGVAGRNFNPDYKPRVTIPTPPFHISGLGFGLERLLLADRIVASSRMHKR